MTPQLEKEIKNIFFKKILTTYKNSITINVQKGLLVCYFIVKIYTSLCIYTMFVL